MNANWESQVYVPLVVPCHAQEVAVVRVQRDQSIGVLDVDFGGKSAKILVHDKINRIVDSGIRERKIVAGDPVVDTAPLRGVVSPR